MKIYPSAYIATGGVLEKKVFLKICKSTSARDSLLIKLLASACNFIKKEILTVLTNLWNKLKQSKTIQNNLKRSKNDLKPSKSI